MTSSQILKSKNDKLIYRIEKLANELNVVFIQDEQTETSVVALAVKCGSFEDPIDIDGLAHFLEHSVFFGSKKFPKNDHYSNFISKNGGNSNAYTDDSYTCYYHEVKNEVS